MNICVPISQAEEQRLIFEERFEKERAVADSVIAADTADLSTVPTSTSAEDTGAPRVAAHAEDVVTVAGSEVAVTGQ